MIAGDALRIYIAQDCAACGKAKGQPCKAIEACARLTAAPVVKTELPSATTRPPWSGAVPVDRPRRNARRDAGAWQAFGDEVRALLTARGLSQRAIGDRLGLTSAAVNHWLTGVSPATLDRVDRLVGAIGNVPPETVEKLYALVTAARASAADTSRPP